MESKWEKFREEIVNLQRYLTLFDIDFLDRDGFKQFADELNSHLSSYSEICITGYFSETIRKELEKTLNYFRTRGFGRVRLISPEFDVKGRRNERNLQALRKMADKGALIKVNSRLHARFLVAYTQSENSKLMGGLLVLGSFDFNTECIGRERYDAGIKTTHPDLINSVIQLFEQIWNEEESKPLSNILKTNAKIKLR